MPDIMLNLISTGRLDDEGYSGSFRNGKGGVIVARAQKLGTLYMMEDKL